VGTIIGSAIFVQPAEVTGRIPSVSGALLVWLVAGALTFLGAMVTAELAAINTETGGVYAYLRDAFSPLFGFRWGWAMFWVMHAGIIAIISMIFARYMAWFFPVGDLGLRLLAVGAILGLSWINYLGVRQGTRVQTAITVTKVGAVFVMIVIGLALGTDGDPAATAIGSTGILDPASGLLGGSPFSDFLLALVAGLFGFGGWHMVTYSAGETVDPERTIPRSLVLGVTIVTGTYLLLNAAYFYVLPLETAMTSTRIAADAADAVLGRGGGAVMSALVAFSTFGTLTGVILAGPRVYMAMSRDGLLFRWAGEIHPSRHTPHRAILLQALWASVLVWTGSYGALVSRVIYTEWLFFSLMAVGLIVMRRRRGRRSTASTPLVAPRLWPWGPVLFAVCAFAVAVNQIVAEPANSVMGLGLVLLGIPVYFAVRSRGA
jgi:APA family basic amino acid/polyamine antiporter